MNQRKIIVFLSRLMLLSLPLYFILWSGVSLSPLQEAVSFQTEHVLSFAGLNVSRTNTRIEIRGEKPFAFFIDEDCTGWKSMLFLFALVFAVPGVKLKKRLFGLVLGLPLVWIVNLSRIITIVFIEQAHGAQLALFFHAYVWKALLISAVLLIWFLWMKQKTIFRFLTKY